MSSIGIIGAGQLGCAIASALARHNIPAILANSRGAQSLAATVAEIGSSIQAGSREEAASRDIVFVAVNWSKLSDALAELPDFNGRIVIDANNPIEAPLFKPFDLGDRSSSEVVTDLVPGAHVVKAFNHLQPQLISADPGREGGRRVLFFSGNDAQAKAKVDALINRLGFFGIDLGALALGSRLVQFPGGPLPTLNLVRFA
jgi:predicted dinucleotide-binding enzyme